MTPESPSLPKTVIITRASLLAGQGANGHPGHIPVPAGPSRRGDVDARQGELARLLAHAGCEWGLIFDPANIRWLTAGMAIGEWYPAPEQPVLFSNLINRSVVCSALDTQAIFDTELDELGFSVKEYPWSYPRDGYLEQLVQNRKVACDRPFRDCINVADALKAARGPLSAHELAGYRELGKWLAHAVEATARNIAAGESETEIAGQLGHRLLKRGMLPTALTVLADDRAEPHRRGLPTDRRVQSRCLIQAVAGKAGLFAAASRTVCFGPPDDAFKTTYDQACRLQAVLRLKAVPGEIVKTALRFGQTYLLETPYEHEWRRTSFGCRIGRSPMEGRLLPVGPPETFVAGQPIAWETALGSARVVDTVVPVVGGEEAVTAPQEWPVRRVRLAEVSIGLPDYLVV